MADPPRQVIGEPVCLLIGARHNHKRLRGREEGAPCGEVAGTCGRGHAKDARFRQVGPKGVDERCYTAITAA
jgi:hypothetical protein